ncbi:SDR family oxidoreductase [Streptomyces abikoensis]|uniref:SDR family oxidoreductase n=1 Tax=Streptomyces abikoensis TaxID=97398 RepID=UPI0033F7BE3B
MVDTTDQKSLATFFASVDRIDHLFTPAASYQVGPMRELTDAEAESPFISKFWGQYHAVKHATAKLTTHASVVLMSGAASVRPPGAAPAYVACNAAIEGLGRGLAVELAPIRVNVVSPGTIDGNLWAQRPADVRQASFAQYGRDALLKRPGTESEVADAVLFLFTNTFMTGSTLCLDGGYALRRPGSGGVSRRPHMRGGDFGRLVLGQLRAGTTGCRRAPVASVRIDRIPHRQEGT